MKLFLEHLSFLNFQKICSNLKFWLDYSYLSALTGSNFAAFNAGKIETKIVIKIEHMEMKKIELVLISEGIELKK